MSIEKDKWIVFVNVNYKEFCLDLVLSITSLYLTISEVLEYSEDTINTSATPKYPGSKLNSFFLNGNEHFFLF